VWLLLAVIAIGGCAGGEGPLDEARLVPSVRLADVRAREGKWREPVMATIGTTSRYALGRSDVVPVEVRPVGSKLQADATGGLDLSVRCPPGVTAPHNLRVELLVAGRKGGRASVERVTRRLGAVCRKGHAGWQPVRVGDLPSKELFLVAVASLLRQPPPVVVSPVADVPDGAELRVFLGLRAAGDALAGSFEVHVTAVVPEGGRRVLARRLVHAHDVVPPGGWVEWRIPLDGARRAMGPRMRFVFAARSSTEAEGLLHVLWGDPTIWAPPRSGPSGRGRNLILVSLDTLRADHLGAAGYPLDVTPNLDRLASEGIMFTDVVSSANWTKPAHATMLTGTFPCVNGVDWGRAATAGPLPAGIVPIAERLRTAGWVTAAFTEDAYVSPDVFQRGFDVFVADIGDSGAFSNIEHTVAAATQWIAENTERRFFVLIHTYQVHEPYEPPPEYATVADTGVPALPGLLPPADDAMADAAAYLGEVAYTDAVMGRLLRRIDALGLRDDTVLVVTSDHGEAFGEHGLRYHGQGLQREQMRVPLIVRAPGVGAPGRRVDDLVSLADLAPTVLELLGFEPSPWMQGVSLVGAMRADGRSPVLNGRTLPLRGMGKLGGIRGATWKVRFGKRSRIWDLSSDPGESHHRIVPESTVAALKRTEDIQCKRGRKLLAQAAEHRRLTRQSQASIEERMKLRALGYIE